MAWVTALKKSPAEPGRRKGQRGTTAYGLFQREQRSLFGEILDWMLTPLLLLWPLSLALTWFVAQGIANKPFDRALEFNLQALTQFVVLRADQPQFNLTQQARDLLRADDTDQVFYVVRRADGRFISGDPDFPPPPGHVIAQAGTVRLRDDRIRSEEVRVAYTWIVRGEQDEQLVLLQVAETLGKRSQLATEIIIEGKPVSAARLHAAGVVNRVAPDGGALEAALAWGDELAKLSLHAVTNIKGLLREAPSNTLPQHFEAEKRSFVDSLHHRDGLEGITAFLDKRAPQYK